MCKEREVKNLKCDNERDEHIKGQHDHSRRWGEGNK
jgi:hypothetical protein